MKYEYRLIIRTLLCFVPISLFYFIFTPLTIYGVYLLLLSYGPAVVDIRMFIGNEVFLFVEACIAGSAYYLLWILNFLSKDIKVVTRIKMIALSFILLYIMNVLRIVILILIALNYGSSWFDVVHIVFWKVITTVYVAGVWIFIIKFYKVKSIPAYSDLKYLIKNIKR